MGVRDHNLPAARRLARLFGRYGNRNADKLSRAKTSLILSIDETLYVHITSCATAKDVFDTLKKTFDDAGLTREIGLLRALIGIRLENCASMEEYVNEIILTAHKLSSIGFVVPEK